MPTCTVCGHENRGGARFCDACGAALEGTSAERRQLATVVFCDLSGSTAMGERTDPESVRELMFRYFHAMRAAIERHGGTVEKFAGDAVMAVFGVPQAHEDDAVRACRSALEMLRRLDELNVELERRFGVRLEARIGVNTGEVVAGDGHETFVTGDAVNVAARLEQAAAAGEVLLGQQTYALAGDAIDVDAMPPIDARGKAARVRAYRLRRVATGTASRRSAAPLVGREEELARLERTCEQAIAEGRCHVVTLIGEAGVGKSRLVAELEGRLAGRAGIFHGRCLSYGEGITFWPLAEIVREAAGIRDEDSAEQARERIEALVDADVAVRIGALVGLGGAVAPEEVAWAVHRLVGALARDRPLVLVVEDLHWAEETLLDVLVGLERLDAPVVVMTTARPDLLEGHADWPGVVRVEPLPGEAAHVLLRELLGEEPGDQLVVRAGGNPLFVQELAALLRQEGDAAGVPATLSALLTARLDRLPAPERDTVERASVEGEVFHRGAIAALLPPDGRRHLPHRLQTLVEREVAFSAQARFVGEAAYRFRHVLVRDAAYAALAKRLRAELHERFADWLSGKAGDRLVEVQELVGYHLEQAFQYVVQLGTVDEGGRALGERAAEHLAAGGRRAADRGDIPAAVNLIERALVLLPEASPARPGLLYALGDTLFSAGEFDRMDAAFLEAEELAARDGQPVVEVAARLDRIRYTVERGARGFTNDDLREAAETALNVFDEAADDAGQATAWMAIGDYHRLRVETRAWQAAYERAIDHARRGGQRRQLGMALARFAGPLAWGPVPADEVIRLMERHRADPDFPLQAKAVWTSMLGQLYALRGQVKLGRELSRAGGELMAELGNVVGIVVCTGCAVNVEDLDDDLEAAEALTRDMVERLDAIGHGWRHSWRAELALFVARQGRLDEAEELLAVVDLPDDDPTAALIRAWIFAARGEYADALRVAGRAVEEKRGSDSPALRAWAEEVWADVLAAAGRRAEAVAALEQAALAWDAKAATLPASRDRRRAAELRS